MHNLIHYRLLPAYWPGMSPAGLIILICSVLTLDVSTNGQAQTSLPNPDVWWKFDKATDDPTHYHIKQFNSSNSGAIHGSTDYTLDRFNNADKALLFTNANAYVRMPDFFGLGTIPENVTISCWININPNSTAEKFIFYAKNSTGDKVFGMKLEDKKFSIRKHTHVGESKAPFDYELFDPINLTDTDPFGWYHLTLIYGEYHTRVFLRRPGSNVCTDPSSLGDCQCNYMFAGTASQEWDLSLNSYFLGSEHGVTVTAIDDLKIWGQAFTIEQAQELYLQESTGNLREHRGQEREITTQDLPVFEVFPNPNHGSFQIQLKLMQDDQVNWSLINSLGKVVHTASERLSAGVQKIEYDNQKLLPGFYIIEVRSAGIRASKKILIK